MINTSNLSAEPDQAQSSASSSPVRLTCVTFDADEPQHLGHPRGDYSLPGRCAKTALRGLASSAFGEHHQSFGTNPIGAHGCSCRRSRHEFLEGIEVGNLRDDPDPVRILRVDERPKRDSKWPEDLFTLG